MKLKKENHDLAKSMVKKFDEEREEIIRRGTITTNSTNDSEPDSEK